MQVWTPCGEAPDFRRFRRFEAISTPHKMVSACRRLPATNYGLCRAAMLIADSNKLFLHPYDDNRILVSARDGILTLYDGQKVSSVPHPGG